MPEQLCTVGDGVEVCFETFGDPDAPAMLLTMGLATQMLGWHEDFCAELADRGFHVIRFDNRDCGRSQRMNGAVPSIFQLLRRDKRAASYTLDDMAGDGIGLLDHLGIETAHVVGASMGGMIAQTMAARYPDRVLSLASMMSNTGARWSGQPSPRLYHVLLKPPPRDREAYKEHAVWVFSKIGSADFERDNDDLRRIAGMSYDRGINPAGTSRQLAAIIASGDRTPLLRDDHGADAGHPRHEGQARAALGRAGDRAGDPGRAAAADRGHGARHPARRVAAGCSTRSSRTRARAPVPGGEGVATWR